MVEIMINRITNKLNVIYNKHMVKFIMSIHKTTFGQEGDWKKLLIELEKFLNEHQRDVVSNIKVINVDDKSKVKYVGAYAEKDSIVFVPNSKSQILVYDIEKKQFAEWGSLPAGTFKWTGCGGENGTIYAFPRASNQLLKIECKTKKAELISIGTSYLREHHYGGVLHKNGRIYQPPRDTDYILVIDINTYVTHKIYLTPKLLHLKLRYCGSVMHPNGYIYFIPERNARVIKFDPISEKFSFIGESIQECMVFGATIALDGNIYGYSLYDGMLKIDVFSDNVKMIFTNKTFGCYGTKLGKNGKLYGIPGNGTSFWEYDTKNERVETVGMQIDKSKAKCAGGATDRCGNIYMAPAFGENMYILKFDNQQEIPKKIYDMFFCDNY